MADSFKASTSRTRKWLLPVSGLLVGGVGAMLLVVFVGMPLALGHRNNLPLEQLYGNFAVDLASRFQAGPTQNPVAADAQSVGTGGAAYTGSCAVCHGATGDGKGVFGVNLYPPATDLRAQDTQGKSDAQLFWIIKNGLSFAGMPGFGGQYNDREIWNLVNYTHVLGKNAAIQIFANVPAATAEELAVANPKGNTVQRGAAVYFASGCHLCHGAVGNAPENLGLRGGREAAEAVRRGRRGMPSYDENQINNSQLQDMIAYLNTFRSFQ